MPGRARITTRYPAVKLPDHPLAVNSSEIIYVHRVVLYDKIGPGVHDCHWCGCEIEWSARKNRRLVADHLDGDTWNNAPGNLVPSCDACNSQRAKRSDFLTRCVVGHELTPENVYTPRGTRKRRCRICEKERAAARRTGPLVGSARPGSKLTEAKVREIRLRRSAGESVTTLSTEYGVSESLIYKLALGRKWSHVS